MGSNYLRKFGYFTMLLFILFSVSGCSLSEIVNKESSIEVIDENTKIADLTDVTVDNIVDGIIKNMSLEEKVGQLFIVDVTALDPREDSVMDKQLSPVMISNLKDYPVGGLILFSRNIDSRKQIIRFNENMQKASEIPLFISVDEEGGGVARIGNNSLMGTTSFPSMAEIGQTNDTNKAFEVGDTIGAEIKELGFNLDYAPVADVCNETTNDEIGTRSFGDDPQMVGDMVKQVVKGLQGQGVSATLKHFPGHGSATEDTHLGAANISEDITELRENEFLPFEKGIKAGVDFIMISHVSVTEVNGGDEVPASLSSVIMGQILREELNFNGIVITDAMNMKAITNYYTSEEATVNSIIAGADIVLMPENLSKAYQAVLSGVEDGKIKESRIDQSLRRIIKTKLERGIIELNSSLVEEATAVMQQQTE